MVLNLFSLKRVVGAKGILLDSGGNTIVTYAWGLGQVTNNQVETYALLRGILITKEEWIITLKIIGGLMVFIKCMLGKSIPMDFKLASIISREKKEASYFEEINFFHIKRDLNIIVD
jgi:hypothetical protein